VPFGLAAESGEGAEMTYVTAQHVAPHLPIEMAVKAGAAIESAHRELFPQASRFTRERDVRRMMRELDFVTLVEILRAEPVGE